MVNLSKAIVNNNDSVGNLLNHSLASVNRVGTSTLSLGLLKITWDILYLSCRQQSTVGFI
jgi:hypothetical protein